MYIQKLYVNDIYWLKFKDLEVFIWLNINLLKYTLFSWHGVKQELYCTRMIFNLEDFNLY